MAVEEALEADNVVPAEMRLQGGLESATKQPLEEFNDQTSTS